MAISPPAWVLRTLCAACLPLWWWYAASACSAQTASPNLPLEANTISRLVEQVEPSVVSILRIRSRAAEGPPERLLEMPPGREPEERELLPNEYGAGVIVKPADSEELLILTAYHVVRGGVIADKPPTSDQSQLQLRFHHRRTCSAVIVAADPRSDLAVLKFDLQELGGSADELRPLDWQTSPPVKKGEIVISLGNPYALARDGSASVSWGIISNLARRPMLSARTEGEQSLFHLGTVLQIDSRLQLGGSGGPVVNLQGQLVGIGTALAAIEGYEKSAGFAIPVAPPMRRVIQTLLAGQEVEYGLLGVAPGTVTADRMREARLYDRQPSAVEVRQMPENSPAFGPDKLHLKDILLRINDQPMLTSADLMRTVGELPPETEVKIEFFRPGRSPFDRGQLLTCKTRLGKWPVRDEDGIVATRPKYSAWRGLRVDYPTARQKFINYEHRFWEGVIVVDVAESSRAAQAQLQPGDVITHVQGNPVRTPGEFQQAIKDQSRDVVLRLVGNKPPVTVKP